MAVNGISGATPTSSPTGVGPIDGRSSQLGKLEFLKLLVTQMQYQDPMKPMDDKEFAAQLAQFSALEQATEQTRWLQINYGLGLVGKEVTYRNEAGETVSNQVKSLRIVDGKPLLSVGGDSITVDQIIETTAAPAQTK